MASRRRLFRWATIAIIATRLPTALLIRRLRSLFVKWTLQRTMYRVIEHLENTEMFNVNLTMAMAKTMSLAASE